MLLKKVIFLFILFIGVLNISAQDEIIGLDDEVLQVVLLDLKDDVISYKELRDPSGTVYEIHLSAVKDFKLVAGSESESKIDPLLLMERFKIVNAQRLESDMESVPSEEKVESNNVNSTPNKIETAQVDANKKSTLEQNYLSWEWDQRNKRLARIVKKIEKNKIEIEKIRSRKRAIQINVISFFSNAFNIKYKQRTGARMYLEGSFYGFNKNNPLTGGSGFSVDGGIRYAMLDFSTDVDKYYRKNLGLGIAAIVGYTNANNYQVSNTLNRLWNRSMFYVGPDLNCHTLIAKNWYIDCSMGVFAFLGTHELIERNEMGNPREVDIVDSYYDGTLQASNKYGSRFEVSLGYAF